MAEVPIRDLRNYGGEVIDRVEQPASREHDLSGGFCFRLEAPLVDPKRHHRRCGHHEKRPADDLAAQAAIRHALQVRQDNSRA
jgi:hypothetical protein